MGLVFAQQIRLPFLCKINRRKAFYQIHRSPRPIKGRCATIASRNQGIEILRQIRTVVRHHGTSRRQRLVHEFQFGVHVFCERKRLGDVQFFGQFIRHGISVRIRAVDKTVIRQQSGRAEQFVEEVVRLKVFARDLLPAPADAGRKHAAAVQNELTQDFQILRLLHAVRIDHQHLAVFDFIKAVDDFYRQPVQR